MFLRKGSNIYLLIADSLLLVPLLLYYYMLFIYEDIGFDLDEFRKALVDNYGLNQIIDTLLLVITIQFIIILIRLSSIKEEGKYIFYNTARFFGFRWQNVLFFAHCMLCLFFGITIAAGLYYCRVLGYYSDEKISFISRVGLLFNSILYFPITFNSLYRSLSFTGVLFTLIYFIGKFLIGKKNGIGFWQYVNIWFSITDFGGRFYPKHNVVKVNFNNASMSPSVNAIYNRTRNYFENHQSEVPTSDDAKTKLKQDADGLRTLISNYLIDDEMKSSMVIEFFSGTSRSLEVGLSRIHNLGHIIISPLEHPSQIDVVKWFHFNEPDVSYSVAKFDQDAEINEILEAQDFDTVLSNKLINAIGSALDVLRENNRQNARIAILLSEVHYLTGCTLTITNLMKTIRETFPNFKRQIIFMIDGSQAVGNINEPFKQISRHLESDDFYYFSGHKWLLSPNTCGVFIYLKNHLKTDVFPYDSFHYELPTSTIEPIVIFGLKASMEFLMKDDMLRTFRDNSLALRNYFLKSIDNPKDQKIKIVYNTPQLKNSETCFLCIKPKDGFNWKQKSDHSKLWKEIKEQRLDLSLMEPEKHMWLGDKIHLRISFSYFLSYKDMNRLLRFLRNNIVGN